MYLPKNEKKPGNSYTLYKNRHIDIGMEFGIEKCTNLIMKSGEKEITEVIELPNKESITTLGEKENYKFLGILEANTIKESWKKK